MENLGSRIKHLREEMKLTQQDLGDIVELHGTNIGRIENGKVFPSSDVLLKMAIYFDVSCDWLMTGDNAKTQILANDLENELLNNFRTLYPDDKEEIMAIIRLKKNKVKRDLSTIEKSSHSTAEIA